VIYLTCENAKITYGDFIAKGVRILLIIITFGICFEYIGIGNTIVTVSFLIVFGGIVLTLSLALGIGLSNVVGDLIRERVKLFGDKKKDHHQ
jgi:small-conductance mechanosensitive channel